MANTLLHFSYKNDANEIPFQSRKLASMELNALWDVVQRFKLMLPSKVDDNAHPRNGYIFSNIMKNDVLLEFCKTKGGDEIIWNTSSILKSIENISRLPCHTKTKQMEYVVKFYCLSQENFAEWKEAEDRKHEFEIKIIKLDRSVKLPTSTFVTSTYENMTVEQIIRIIFQQLSTSTDLEVGLTPEDMCLRIQEGTEILHPKATLEDNQYIQTCFRYPNSPVYLHLETFKEQKRFVLSAQDDRRALTIYKDYIGENIDFRLRLIDRVVGEVRDLCKSEYAFQSSSVLFEKVKFLCNYFLDFDKTICSNLIPPKLENAIQRLEVENRNVQKVNDRSASTRLQLSLLELFNNVTTRMRKHLATIFEWRMIRLPYEHPAVMNEDKINQHHCESYGNSMPSKIAKSHLAFSLPRIHVRRPDSAAIVKKFNNSLHFEVALAYAGRLLSSVYNDTTTPIDVIIDHCEKIHSKLAYDILLLETPPIWHKFEDYRIESLPRETVLNLRFLYSKKEDKCKRFLLGWANVPIFDEGCKLREGKVIIGLWPPEGLPSYISSVHYQSNVSDGCDIVEIKFPERHVDYVYEFYRQRPLIDLDCLSTQHIPIVEKTTQKIYTNMRSESEYSTGAFFPGMDRKVVGCLWNLRRSLKSAPFALVSLALASPVSPPKQFISSKSGCQHKDMLFQLYNLLSSMKCLPPFIVLRLLLPDVADQGVRYWAVCCFAQVAPEGLIPFLPYLLEAVNYDLYLDWSGLVSLLLHRACLSVQLFNAIMWEIRNKLSTPNMFGYCRLQVLRTCLCWLRGKSLESDWDNLKTIFTDILDIVTNRSQGKLDVNLKKMNSRFSRECSMPYAFGLVATEIDLKNCRFVSSFNTPLIMSFTPRDNIDRNFTALFKVGDDLRVDALVCHLALIADEIWQAEGLDLKMKHFRICPTSLKKGVIEMVPECLPLRKIQNRDKEVSKIFKWLKNSGGVSLFKKLDNFNKTLAAWSVLTHVLGLKDRHNDNIMICSSGHIFHIDFSKVLGKIQTFLTVNRERTPFVLTKDIIYVITRSEKKLHYDNEKGLWNSKLFDMFAERCCQAYNILRKYSNAFISILQMASTFPQIDVGNENIEYLRTALALRETDMNASAYFRSLIVESANSKSTEVNFAFHNFAKRRANS